MGKLDFLKTLGNSKDSFEVVDTSKDLNEKIKYLDILINRHLMAESFKNEIIEFYKSKKINEDKFLENVNKSIAVYERAEVKIVSFDENMFKLKNDIVEYVGEPYRLPIDKFSDTKNTGKVSYTFAKALYEHLRYRNITIGEINTLNDILDFRLFTIMNVEQVSIPKE